MSSFTLVVSLSVAVCLAALEDAVGQRVGDVHQDGAVNAVLHRGLDRREPLVDARDRGVEVEQPQAALALGLVAVGGETEAGQHLVALAILCASSWSLS